MVTGSRGGGGGGESGRTGVKLGGVARRFLVGTSDPPVS
jgi:hypothetical protein